MFSRASRRRCPLLGYTVQTIAVKIFLIYSLTYFTYFTYLLTYIYLLSYVVRMCCVVSRRWRGLVCRSWTRLKCLDFTGMLRPLCSCKLFITSSNYRLKNILFLVLFAKDAEVWFGYSKLNVFGHTSSSCLSWMLNINNERTTITAMSNINNIE